MNWEGGRRNERGEKGAHKICKQKNNNQTDQTVNTQPQPNTFFSEDPHLLCSPSGEKAEEKA